jgi:SAM-dependent methyltransferase
MSKRRAPEKASKKKSPKPFDKYDIYRRAVQSAENDVEFFRDVYRWHRKKTPTTLREDFCGTFAICNEWVKLNSKFRAQGIDLDHEPIQYGLSHYVPNLSKSQRERLEVHQENVLNPGLPHADIICAMNFSHYVFKDRAMMRSYFHNCYNTLNEGGIFIADSFGGPACMESNEDKTKHRGFTYYWQQESFDPITSDATFHIHFKMDDERKRREQVFTYEWRMWSIQELRDLMMEVGFKKTTIYWEGSTRKGTGNGIFKATTHGEECQAWIAYVVGDK